MVIQHFNVPVIYIGAGPAGLCSAIQTKLRYPHLAIHILEKRAAYERSHPLKIHRRAFRGCAADPRLRAIIERWLEESDLRVDRIEGDLSQLAQQLGIVIRKNSEVRDPRLLLQEYPDAAVIVGADGAHSQMRKEIFQDKMGAEGDLKFLIEVKYDVWGRGRQLRWVKEVYPTLKIMQSIATEHIGRERGGKTRVTLRLLIDKEKYARMRGATFRHPFTFQNENLIDQQVMENIRTWMGIKRLHGEVQIPDSEKITVTRLGYYAAREVVRYEGNTTYCLLGDSALGVPFFQGFENGVLAGTELAKRVGETLALRHRAKTLSPIHPMTRYSLYVKGLSRWAILAARIKNFFLNIFVWFVQISARVPWQVNYWTEGRLRRLQEV